MHSKESVQRYRQYRHRTRHFARDRRYSTGDGLGSITARWRIAMFDKQISTVKLRLIWLSVQYSARRWTDYNVYTMYNEPIAENRATLSPYHLAAVKYRIIFKIATLIINSSSSSSSMSRSRRGPLRRSTRSHDWWHASRVALVLLESRRIWSIHRVWCLYAQHWCTIFSTTGVRLIFLGADQ